MARKINKDWTDELREMIDGVELSPSEGGWEQLKADLHPRKAVWWPYAVPAVACLLLGGVFLFRGGSSANDIDVVTSVPAAMVADGARVDEGMSLTAGGIPETVPPSAMEEGGPLAVGSARLTSSGIPPAAETPVSTIAEAEPLEDAWTDENARGTSSETSTVAEQINPSEEGGPQTATETVSAEPRQEVEEEPALPSLAVQAPSFDIEDEPVARRRGQRRKVTVTVSAGGAFGSAGNGFYIAQAGAPVTKAAGEVMDITEVIQHSTPRQTAVGLSVPVAERLDIGTGVDYMELNSVVGSGSQNLEWIGVPLRLGYRIADWGTSSISLGAGFKGEKCLSATLLGLNYNEPFQWAANMGADCRVRLLGPVSLSLVPEFSYYFTETVLPTYRTDRPLTFTLRAGLSLNL